MKCTIHKTEFGKIVSVTTKDGQESQLFSAAARTMAYNTLEEAVEVISAQENLSGVISKAPQDLYSNGEPKLFYRTPEGVTSSYKEALTKAKGEPITLGFKGSIIDFISIRDLSSTLDNNTPVGVINNAIVNGNLQEAKVYHKGSYSWTGIGNPYEAIVGAKNVFAELNNLSDNEYIINGEGLISLPIEEVQLPETKGGDLQLINSLSGTGASTQEFFGNVVTGGDARYEPSKPYEYEEDFSGSERAFQDRYDQKMGNFDQHIATSIPTFRETQIKKGAAIVSLLEDKTSPVVYDLGGSEGSWVKTITEESNGNIKTINLDPSPEMQASFNRNKPENSEMSLEAFYQGWDDVKTHVPKEKADVVHESMMFQFIDNNGERADYIKEVKDKYLKENGLFLTEEKFQMNSPSEYQANEELKVPHKDKYYTKEQQSLKADQVLVGMKENQANYSQYLSELKEQFKYVQPYWFSGNFRGIVATDNKEMLDKFLEELGTTSNPKYTFSPTIDSFDLKNEDVRFSVDGEGRNIPTNQSEIENVLAPIAEVMRQNVSADSVNILNTEEISEVLKGIDANFYSKGTKAKGFVHDNKVYLNSDLMTLDTPFHEIGHIWLDSTKKNNPELFKRGIALMKSEGKVYTDYVKKTQPNLKGAEILEEALAQAIGENGAQLLKENKKSDFKQWLSDFFNWIAEQAGISQYVEEGKLGDLTLEQFSTAVAVEMIKTQTVDGLITSPTGTSGNLKNNGKFIPTEGKVLNVKNYPSEMVTPLEVLSLEDVIKQYEGRVIFTTSDATGVSKDQSGNPVLGGPAYIMLKENVEGKIGFASVDSDTANSTATRAFKMGNGKPVAVLIMVQQGATSLGNYYGSTFLYEGIKEIKSSLSKEEFTRFVDDLTEVSKAFLTEHVIDVPRKKFKAKPHHNHFLETFQRFKNQEPTLEEYHQVVTADTNFNFSRNFLQAIFNNVHQVPNKSTKGTKEYIESLINVKRIFSEIGHDYNKFSTQYNDVNLVDHNDVNEKLYGAVAGFEMRTDFSSPSEMHSEYIAPAQTRGITHPQFNGKLPSDRSFILDSMYKVNENFGDFVPKKVSLKEEYLDRRDELEEEGYTESEADAIIAHEIGPEAFVPTMEYNSNPQAQISQGMGLPMMDEAEFATGIFKYATKTDFSISENPLTREEFKDFIKNGRWGMLTAENPDAIKVDDETNRLNNERAKQWLRDKNYSFTDVKGKYGNEENSILVYGLSREDAFNFSKEFNQDSVATDEGLIYKDGSISKRIKGEESFGGNYEDNFSTIEIQGEPFTFSVGYERKRGALNTPTLEPMNNENSKLYPFMTEDGEGNFVFNHWSSKQFDSITPGAPGTSFTTNKESGAWSKVGGVSYFYTKDGDREQKLIGDYGYQIKVPKEEVYDIEADRESLEKEAFDLFLRDGNTVAWDDNHKAAYISKIALTKGYTMTVVGWEGKARAQSLIPQIPSDTYINRGVKEIKKFDKEYESNLRKGITQNRLQIYPVSMSGWYLMLSDFDAKFKGKFYKDSLSMARMNPQRVFSIVGKSTLPNNEKVNILLFGSKVWNRAPENLPDNIKEQIIQRLIDNNDIEYTCE